MNNVDDIEVSAAAQNASEPRPEDGAAVAAAKTEDPAAARLRVERALTANHANTLPMLEILRACNEARPYRDIEDDVYDLPVMQLSHQNAHALSLLLVKAGALEQIPVEEPQPAESAAAGVDASAGDAQPALVDQPVDYLLVITEAGREVLADFDPVKRYGRMLAGEPSSYRAIYRKVLSLCEQGISMDDIEQALAGIPAMRTPKTVYAGHFVSNLETVDGIRWADGLWTITTHGQAMAEV